MKLLASLVLATNNWLDWLVEVVTENHRSGPWTVMVATWSAPEGTGTDKSVQLSLPTGVRSMANFEHVPLGQVPTRAKA